MTALAYIILAPFAYRHIARQDEDLPPLSGCWHGPWRYLVPFVLLTWPFWLVASA